VERDPVKTDELRSEILRIARQANTWGLSDCAKEAVAVYEESLAASAPLPFLTAAVKVLADCVAEAIAGRVLH
jgi:hypothetical protein